MISKFISLVVILISILQGGIGDDMFLFIVEGRGGMFQPVPKNFTKIYGDDEIIQSASLGIGYKNAFLIARYRRFEAEGKSIVKGIDLEGLAKWRQEFISLGIRSYSLKTLYFELAYVIGSIEESISTNEPSFTALNSSFSTSDDRGASIALGFNIPILLGFSFSGEAEYIFLQTTLPNQSNGDSLKVGGPIFSFGISFVL